MVEDSPCSTSNPSAGALVAPFLVVGAIKRFDSKIWLSSKRIRLVDDETESGTVIWLAI